MDRSNRELQTTHNRKSSNRSVSESSKPTTTDKSNKDQNQQSNSTKGKDVYNKSRDNLLNSTKTKSTLTTTTKTSNTIVNFFLYWEKFDSDTLIFFRFCFYMMMSIDFWCEIPRAANYWRALSAFNTTHFSLPITIDRILSALIDTDSFLLAICIGGLLSLRVAIGISSTRFEPFLIAAIKFYIVFFSQTDNFQHHYLLFLLLLVLSTIDWRSINNNKLQHQKQYCWQIRLILIQLSAVYIWTSVAKLHPNWINGVSLPRMIGPEFRAIAQQSFAMLFSESIASKSMMIISNATIVTELFLAVAIHINWLSPLSSLVGILMHYMMLLSGLRIGTFSQFMMLLYIITLPENPVTTFIVDTSKSLSLIISNQFYKLSFESSWSSPSTSNSNSKIKGLIIGIIFFILIKLLIVDQLITDSLLNNVSNKSLYIITIFLFIKNLIITKPTATSTASSYQLKDFGILLIGYLLISYASISTPQIRKLHVDMGALAITASNMDKAIEKYSEALAQGRKELGGTTSVGVGASFAAGRLVPLEEQDYEFVGDLGLFLESKNRWAEAEQLYTEFLPKFPNHLKLHAGLIRTYDHNNQYSKICQQLPTIEKLATQQSESDQCHSIDCSRYRGHAKYVLNLIKNIQKKCKK